MCTRTLVQSLVVALLPASLVSWGEGEGAGVYMPVD